MCRGSRRPSAKSFLNPKILGEKSGGMKKCHHTEEKRLRCQALNRKHRFTETTKTDRGAPDGGNGGGANKKI
jgi:hypothetical protein